MTHQEIKDKCFRGVDSAGNKVYNIDQLIDIAKSDAYTRRQKVMDIAICISIAVIIGLYSLTLYTVLHCK